MALLVVLATVGASVVYAATIKPDFKFTVSPKSKTVTKGQTAVYKLKFKRLHGFKGAINLTAGKLPKGAKAVWKLPDGRTLPLLKRRGKVVVLAQSKTVAILRIRTAASTPTRKFKPVVTAVAPKIKRKRTKKLVLRVTPAAVVPQIQGQAAPAAPAAALTLVATPASRSVLQGDETTYSVSIARENFTGPVTLGVAGLPAGSTFTADPDPSVSGSSATVTIAVPATAPVRTYDVTITGSGGGVSGAASTSLVVQATVPFGVTGDLGTTLVPGRSAALDLQFTNPYDFPLKVESLGVALRSTASACDVSQYQVTQLQASALPLVLPPGASRLSGLVADTSQWPRVGMLDLDTSQDACKGATLTLDYSGSASK